MLSENELDRLFVKAQENFIHEDEFFSQLLHAAVYVHVPVSDDSANVRLVQFRHPDGFDAIPFFTTARRAEKAGSHSVRTLRMPCVDLLKSTRGATFMVNPNDGGAVIYPEEVAGLLDNGALETFEKVSSLDASIEVRPAESPPDKLLNALRDSAPLAPFIKDVYLLEQRKVGVEDGATLLIYVGADTTHMDRAARFVVTVVQGLNPRPERIVDVAVYDAAAPKPSFLDEMQAMPIMPICRA